MNLIYKGYIKFLRDVTGKELADIKEGYFGLINRLLRDSISMGISINFTESLFLMICQPLN